MQAIKITAYPDDPTQIEALKAVMKALKIRYELNKEKNSYDPEFVEKIKESRQQAEEGKVTRIDKHGLKELLDL